ncbi:MAG: hypothetical protein HC901_04370 [Bdellovibrionaceae bacterium]|nr:hypothetical protein [Pseudobdellovibrionaceae bacterium]
MADGAAGPPLLWLVWFAEDAAMGRWANAQERLARAVMETFGDAVVCVYTPPGSASSFTLSAVVHVDSQTFQPGDSGDDFARMRAVDLDTGAVRSLVGGDVMAPGTMSIGGVVYTVTRVVATGALTAVELSRLEPGTLLGSGADRMS